MAGTGSYDDGAAMRQALDGVGTLFMGSGSEAADRVPGSGTPSCATASTSGRTVTYQAETLEQA